MNLPNPMTPTSITDNEVQMGQFWGYSQNSLAYFQLGGFYPNCYFYLVWFFWYLFCWHFPFNSWHSILTSTLLSLVLFLRHLGFFSVDLLSYGWIVYRKEVCYIQCVLGFGILWGRIPKFTIFRKKAIKYKSWKR